MKWTPIHGKPLVCVHWLDADASSPTDAFHEEEIAGKHHTTPMETYGLLLREDADGVTLMNEFYVDEGKHTFRGRNFIPACQLVKVDVLLAPAQVKPRRTRKSYSDEDGTRQTTVSGA